MTKAFNNKFQELVFIGVILLGFITFYIETDIYTPSFPVMLNFFHTNEEGIQLLLSMNFLGLCLSSLLFGPASDAYGRKIILCSGLLIFMLGSLGCAFTSSLDWMIAFRFFQGVGCGAITSAGLATFFDVYPPEKSSRLTAMLNGTVGGLMALAPMLGNWISLHVGWRANFYLIAILAILTFICTFSFLKETLPQDKRPPLSVKGIFKNYFSLLINFPFMAHTLIWCTMFSIVIVFIANLSLIFVDYLAVPQTHFGYYQTAVMGAFFIGSMGAAYLIKLIGLFNTKIVGSTLFVAGVLMLGSAAFLDMNSPLLLIFSMSLISLGSASSMMMYFSYSMTHISDKLKGSAMSLTQSLRLCVSSALVLIAAQEFDGSMKPIALLALGCLGFCLLLYTMLYRKKQHYAVIA